MHLAETRAPSTIPKLGGTELWMGPLHYVHWFANPDGRGCLNSRCNRIGLMSVRRIILEVVRSIFPHWEVAKNQDQPYLCKRYRCLYGPQIFARLHHGYRYQINARLLVLPELTIRLSRPKTAQETMQGWAPMILTANINSFSTQSSHCIRCQSVTKKITMTQIQHYHLALRKKKWTKWVITNKIVLYEIGPFSARAI